MKWLENEEKTVRMLLHSGKVKIELAGVGIAEIELGEEAYEAIKRLKKEGLEAITKLLKDFDLDDYFEDAGLFEEAEEDLALSEEELADKREDIKTAAKEAYLSDFAAEAEEALEKLSKGSKLYEIEYFKRTYYRGPGDEQKLQKKESVKFKAYLKVADVEEFGSPYRAYLAAKKRYA